YPYVDGLKTGYTSEAKFCLTASAKKEDMRLVSVVMGAETVKDRNEMIMNMIDYGYHTFEVDKLYEKEEIVSELKDIRSEKLVYPVVTKEPISTLYRKGKHKEKEVQTEIKLQDDLVVPLEKGEEVGTIQMKDESDVVHESPLIIQEPVEKASLWTLFSRNLKHMTKYSES